MWKWLTNWFGDEEKTPPTTPQKIRGRIGVTLPASNGPKAKAEPEAEMSIRVFRAASGKWETIERT